MAPSRFTFVLVAIVAFVAEPLFAAPAPASSRSVRRSASNTMPMSLDQGQAGRAYAQAASDTYTLGAFDDQDDDDADEPGDVDASESASSSESHSKESAVTTRQSVDAYNTLEDGQPGDPGSFELLLQTGWSTRSGHHRDDVSWLTEFQYNGDGNDFLRNSQFTLGIPLELGMGPVDGNADVVLGWQQRWVSDDGNMPTLATLTELRLPTGYDSSGIDATLTGIVAKDLGPGTVYFNAFAKTANGNNIDDVRHFQWGFRAGYKWRVSDEFAVIADYVNQSSEQTGHSNLNELELSSEWDVNDHLSIGPGVVIGLDDNEETPDFGAGVRFMIKF